jgi:predicted  nucleic acid-binding Zn-ribbon protein
MNQTLHQLFELQTLEFGDRLQPDNEARISALRAGLPATILAHYDRLCDTGKKGVATIHNQACSGCHICVPSGILAELRRPDTLRLCENCRRYLFLREEPAPVAVSARRGLQPKARGRKPKLAAGA